MVHCDYARTFTNGHHSITGRIKTSMTPTIPDIVIGRLPVYLRALTRLSQEGVDVTSSHELGQRLGISSAQIRKDLSHFGGFGKQGTGYQISYLIDQLRQVLKVNRSAVRYYTIVGSRNAVSRSPMYLMQHPTKWVSRSSITRCNQWMNYKPLFTNMTSKWR
jgi:biotin operon repressor